MNRTVKKSLSYVLLVAFALVLVAGGLSLGYNNVEVQAANLVLNPGFESGTTSWSVPAQFSQSNVDKHSGTYSLKLAGTASWSNMFQTVNVSTNTNYTFSFWGKCGGSEVFKVMDMSWAVIQTANTTANNAWTYYSITFNSGSRTQVMVDVTDSAAGTCYFDDFSVDSGSATATPTSAATATPTPAPGGTIGNTTDGTSTDSAAANYYNALRYQASSNMTVNSMKIKVGTAGTGKMKCAIYSDNAGVPGTFLKGTNELSNLGTGWQTFSLTSSQSLTSGTYYWLVSWRDSSYGISSTTSTACNSWGALTYTASWPTNLPAQGGAADYRHSFYAYSGATPTPGPTATPTPASTSTPTPGATPVPGKMVIGANFWNKGWGAGWADYFASGVNWSTTTNPWNPTFLSDLNTIHYKVLRFMDWGETNGCTFVNWSDRTQKTADQYTSYGIAYEWMIDLCNRVGADMWVCVPAHSTPSFANSLATLIKNNLNSNLKVYVEWSNEVWNYGFEQSTWIRNNKIAGLPTQLTMPDGRLTYVDGDNIWSNYVYYSCRALNEFNNVFGVNSSRVVKVIGGQLGYAPWGGSISSPMADFHLAATKNSACNPWNVKIDAYAVAPYWNGNTVTDMRNSLSGITTDLSWFRESLRIDGRSIPLVCYEGGNDAPVAANQDSGNYQLQIDALNAVKAYVQGAFNYYTHVGADGGHYWGLKQFTGQADSAAHKWRGVMQWMASNP